MMELTHLNDLPPEHPREACLRTVEDRLRTALGNVLRQANLSSAEEVVVLSNVLGSILRSRAQRLMLSERQEPQNEETRQGRASSVRGR